MGSLQTTVDDLLRWENENDVLRFKFQYEGTLIWPLVRSTVFIKILENRSSLQSPHASAQKLKISQKVSYLYRTIKERPFSVKRHFDILFFGSTAGISLKVHNKWFGRISDYFVLEYNDRSLILDESYRLQYRHPRAPANVRCYDYIKLYAFLKGQLLGKVGEKDLETIRELMSFLRASWGEQLKEEDYFLIERILKVFCLRLVYLHKAYLRLFDQVKPKVLLIETASYGGVNAWIVKWAKDRGIVTAEPQHGCIDIPYIYSDRLFYDEEYKKYLPDYLLLYGQYWHDLVRSPSKKIIIGNPHFDSKKREYTDVKKRGGGQTILIVSQGIVTSAMVELALQLAKSFDGKEYKIIFRLHPGEVPFIDRYARLEAISNIQIDKDQDIYKLIQEADYIVAASSLTVFEAAGLNKKIYILENGSSEAYVPQDLGLRFRNAQDLFELISKDQYQPVKDSKIFWADGWRENYHCFIDLMLK